MLFLVSLARAAEPPPAAPELPLSHGVLLSVAGHAGNVVVDTQKLAALGITLQQGEARLSQRTAPLADGLRVLGLDKERVVDGAVDSLMYFDANGDTYLDALDPAWPALSIFADRNGDGRAQAGEVRSLQDLGVDSISRFGSIRMKDGR
ncbi:MAG: hypothetical protein R3F59_04250 [Myxococcota bacterium]